MSYWVYILTTGKNTVLYTGMSSRLPQRMEQHEGVFINSFTKRYNVNKLVYVEEYQDINEAAHREKCIKRWKRDWKIALIEKQNPEWWDLLRDKGNQIPAFAGTTAGDMV